MAHPFAPASAPTLREELRQARQVARFTDEGVNVTLAGRNLLVQRCYGVFPILGPGFARRSRIDFLDFAEHRRRRGDYSGARDCLTWCRRSQPEPLPGAIFEQRTPPSYGCACTTEQLRVGGCNCHRDEEREPADRLEECAA